MMWDDGGGWVLLTTMFLLFWGLLVFGGVALFRATRPAPESDGSPARRLLDERFARSEIDEDDYTRRRTLLGQAGQDR